MRRKFLLSLSLIVVLASVNAPQLFRGFHSAAVALSPQSTEQAGQPASAIIELESDPVAINEEREMPAGLTSHGVDFRSVHARDYESRLVQEHQDFMTRAALIAPGVKVRAELRKLANAVSIEASPQEIAAIGAIPGVKRVQATKEYHATLDASVPLINAPAFWDRLGGSSSAGQGVKIAILDTGIDITNPLFSDSGFTSPAGFPRTNNGSDALTNNKVIVAKSFVGGTPPLNASDQNGHGTNVAGIAAGDFNTPSPLGPISGVAPQAFLGNYRVLDAGGNGRDDRIAQALEEAVSDGFDVLSMSLGATADATLNFLDQTVETAVNIGGKVVVISAGNAGNSGSGDAMTIGSPGVAPSAITVAASSNGHIVGPILTVTGPAPVDAGLSSISAVQGVGSTKPLDGSFTSLPLSQVTTNRGCSSLTAGSLTGQVALIERGNCSFSTKVNNAAQAGASAVIIYNQDISENPDSGGDHLVLMDVTGVTIPAVFTTRTAGVALRDFVQAHAGATLSIAPLGSSPAISDLVADFSSRGPTRQFVLKPDIAAPGVIIYSGAIKTTNADGVSDPSGFLAVSGTSQSAPHIAGSAALVRQLHPSFTPQQIKSVLMNSAVDSFLNANKTMVAGVLTQGGGRVDLDRASSASATIAPSGISLGLNKLKKKTVTINQDISVTRQLDGQSTYSMSVQQLDPDPGVSVSLSTTSLSLNKGQTGTVTFTIVALKTAEKRDYTGYVLLSGSDGQTLRVPYWVRYRKKV